MSEKQSGTVGRPLSFWIVLIFLLLFVLAAIFADLLASDIPLMAKKGSNFEWPIFNQAKYLEGKSFNYQDYDRVIMPLIPFNHESTNIDQRYKPPGTVNLIEGRKKTHLLGTDRLGRDVAAGLIFGSRKSLFIAFTSVLMAFFIGLFLGSIAGYWGDQMQLTWSGYLLFWLVSCAYAFYLLYYHLVPTWVLVGGVIFLLLPYFYFKNHSKRKIKIRLDSLVLKLIEIFQSIPGLIILIVVAALVRNPSLFMLSLVIGALRWTGFARFTRAEIMKIKVRDYITAAKISGIGSWKIISRYILPEDFGPLIIVFAFGVSSVILLESTLSFLGIGLPADEVTWGTMLAQARQHPSAWWLAILPGISILVLVLSLNLLGDHLKRQFDVHD
jgi:peptide/nickel transport system permease protein